MTHYLKMKWTALYSLKRFFCVVVVWLITSEKFNVPRPNIYVKTCNSPVNTRVFLLLFLYISKSKTEVLLDNASSHLENRLFGDHHILFLKNVYGMYRYRDGCDVLDGI